MSMHASKGLTADLVVLAGLVDGVMPRVGDDLSPAEQEAQLQEQRRVFFVGLTRTSQILVLSSYSQLDIGTAYRLQVRRGLALGYGRGFRTFATPFLGELGDELPRGVGGQDWITSDAAAPRWQPGAAPSPPRAGRPASVRTTRCAPR
jgi:DNA helicase-2/ATP-dependent DNA helicase PcrA